MKRFSASIRKAVVAAVTAVAVSGGVAHAAPQPALPQLPAMPELPAIPGLPGFNVAPNGTKEMVVFGDSFSANAGKGGDRGLEAAQTPLIANCATDMDNWPKNAARHLGYSLGDWSCNGTGSVPTLQLQAYLELAINHGDLGPGTKEVVLMYGGLDAFQWVDAAEIAVTQHNNPFTAEFTNSMRRVKERVAQVAPQARVSLVSYPEFGVGDNVCLVNSENQINPINVPGFAAAFETMNRSIREAAYASGMNFVDLYPATRGHGTCAPRNEDRWVAGISDPAMGPMPNHPTVHGSKAMGKIIADKLR